MKKKEKLPLGFPTFTSDIEGNIIRLGDIVGYDFKDDTSIFKVVFEDNAFRKAYKGWSRSLVKPILEFGRNAELMRLKIIVPILIINE